MGDAPASRPEDILVAIPALDEETHIEACIRSLIGCDPFMRRVRVVVADGGSKDGTVARITRLQAEFPALRLVENPDRLQSAAVNAVARDCAVPSHRFLIRCDAHAVYPPNYVRSVAVSLAVRADAAAVVTAMDAVGDGCFQRAAAWIVDTPLGSGGSAHRGGTSSGWVDHGHHAGMRLDWFLRVGGYDPEFSHNEDAEFDHRLGLAGGRIWLDASIRLDYVMRPTVSALARQYWSYGRGRARTVLKHRMKPRARQLAPVINLLGILACLAVSPLLPAALAWPLAYLAVLMGASGACAARLRSFCGLWAGPALAVMHMCWGAGFLRQLAARGPDRGT